jgi:hypothetical protein
VTTPAERAFVFMGRGEIREQLLSEFRIGLRLLRNPETGVVFTEDEIARATQRGSRWWREANAIDLMGMAQQSRALWLADQVRPERAASSWLRSYHGDMWGMGDPLAATPGSGPCLATGTAGTVFTGSTIVPDGAANTARDPAGLRYQCFVGKTADTLGNAPVTLIGIDTGPSTNLATGTILTWENPPLGAKPTFSVTTTFTGGLPQETSAEYAARLRSRIRHKQGAGNNPQMRGWARDASNAVLDAYVYACAMHAGSTLVCVLQKRGGALGPTMLLANAATLTAAIASLVPPGSSVVPARAFIVVTTFTAEPTDVVLEFSQPKGSGAGWTDLIPWPHYTNNVASIQTLADQSNFQIHSTGGGLPGGVTDLATPNTPHLMWWNPRTGRFTTLDMETIHDAGGSNYNVVLGSPPSDPSGGGGMAIGDWISPDMARRDTVSIAVEQYFDSLGPGELVDLALDSRADRAARFPDPSEEAPSRAGNGILTTLADALGAALADSKLITITTAAPSLPTDVVLGPHKLTIGRLAVYEET